MSHFDKELDLLNGSDYTRAVLLGSFMTFLRVFFELRTGREFSLSRPTGRESHYITIAKGLKEVFNGSCKRLMINVPPRYGKAIYDHTPILTKYGWKIAKHVKVGDYLIGSSGYTKVTGVYPQGVIAAKEVVFSDGCRVICNGDHLWSFYEKDKKELCTKSTNEIFQSLGSKKTEYSLPLVNGEFNGFSSAISPYLLGLWLSYGNEGHGKIVTDNIEIVENLGHEDISCDYYEDLSCTKTSMDFYAITSVYFEEDLENFNLLNNKHIPEEIFNWDKQDRLSLLQGIMDSLGDFDKMGIPYVICDKSYLIECIKYLVSSLGGLIKRSNNNDIGDKYYIYLPEHINCFRISSKSLIVRYGMKPDIKRTIKTISYCGQCEMVCFTVDAEDKLFSVGTGMVLTHNSEMMVNFVPWAMANYPDSNFIYTSYAQSLASMQTQIIRETMSLPSYKKIFGIELDSSTSAKDDFKTIQGGRVFAAGAGGPITGRGAGIKNIDRFGGCIIIDDAHKPEEVHSDAVRYRVNEWFYNTLQSRLNDKDTPIIAIGQMLHEDDLMANLRKIKKDNGDLEWNIICLPSLDAANNPLYPEMHDLKSLLKMKRENPYVFASQYQQNPQPAGGGIFKEEWFIFLDVPPQMISTFITCDTAETDKNYNDATVFSFWGIYKIKVREVDTGLYGIHWIDCMEVRVEPKDLENEFYDFYARCMSHPVKPTVAAIEKKSTGVTLCSLLKGMPGLRILEIDRNRSSGSKITRFLECQPFVSSQRVTFTRDASHARMCIDHCKKITGNNTHAHDDIADTMQTAIQVVFIDKTLMPRDHVSNDSEKLKAFSDRANLISRLKRRQ